MSELFQLDRLRAEPSLRGVDWSEQLGSTSDRALEMAGDRELPTPLLVVTDTQTAGRGRGANRWWSALGALTFTLVYDLPNSIDSAQRPRASLRAGLAVRQALAPFAPHLHWTLKWPNDLFLEGRKICGMLIESSASRPGRLVIGIGVNVNNSFATAPPALREIATSLVDCTSRVHELTDVLLGIVRELTRELATPGDATGALSARWTSHCHLTGRTIQIESNGRRTTGLCQGIDDEGALVLATPEGERRFLSGTIARY